MAIADAPLQTRNHVRGRIGLIATTLVVAVTAVGIWILTHRDSEAIITYDTARAMAAKIGCEKTFSLAPNPGGADAGQCTLTDGTAVDLRVYPGAGEGVAWLDGARSANPERAIAVTGGSWAALIHSNNRVTGNSVVGPLTTP